MLAVLGCYTYTSSILAGVRRDGSGEVRLSYVLRFHPSVQDDEVDSHKYFGNPLVFFL